MDSELQSLNTTMSIEKDSTITNTAHIKKVKFSLDDVVMITNIQFPEFIEDGKKYKSKYRVKISYTGKDGKKHDKSVFFGQIGAVDFIDHKDIQLRNYHNKYIKDSDNYFDPDYWNKNFLNGETSDISKSFDIQRSKILKF